MRNFLDKIFFLYCVDNQLVVIIMIIFVENHLNRVE